MSSDSDSEIDNKRHEALINNVINLDGRQQIGRATRSEPTAQVSEYNLIKSLGDSNDTVRLYDLTKSLKNRAVDVELRKKVKKTEVKSKTLAKPLEKPQADRIRRSTAYESTKTQLDRWEPVVTANRVSTNLLFPLEDPNFDKKETRNVTSNWVLKSNLEKELEKLEPKVEVVEVETDSLPKLTLREMMERRKELAKLRRYQNYKEIKAKRQNKIKSKKFRKIQRKEEIKEQMKEFELLQKTNPEQALKKLEKIEMARAEERASLRHKSTGKWARNQQIRAKYDKESRKVLAEQLAISKDLMQKQQENTSSESEDDNSSDDRIINSQDGDNPWTNKIQQSKEIEDFVSSYRKFWEEENMINSKKSLNQNVIVNKNEHIEKNNEAVLSSVQSVEEKSNPLNKKGKIQLRDDLERKTENIISKQSVEGKTNDLSKGRKRKLAADFSMKKENIASHQKKRKIKKDKDLQVDSASTIWEVTSVDLENNNRVDDIFDNIEYRLKDRVNKKLGKAKSKLGNKSKVANKKMKASHEFNDEKNKNDSPKDLILLSNNSSKPSTPNLESLEKSDNSSKDIIKNLESLKLILESQPSKRNKPNENNALPEKVTNVKPVSLNSSIPDVLTYDDNEETADRAGIITEAFEDADIIEAFEQDKKDEIDKDKPKDIDLTLPGWGSWGGKDISIPKRKKKRFIIKAPKQVPRKDMNKGHLIINESGNDKLKSHLVSEVPFPFKTVKDFEASVRAPIGNTFVPETAYRKMIKPTLRTKIGAIIEPISEDVLLHKEKKKKKN